MRKTANWTILTVLFICFISCSKDNNSTNSSSLSGNWTFNGLHALTSSTAQDNEGGVNFKTVTTSDYTTTSNGGTVNIAGNTMTGTAITYAADITAFAQSYEDNVLVDTFSSSFPIVIPPSNSSSGFEQIGTDSIHYTSGGLLGSGGSGTPAATGAKFSISGDILTLTSNVAVDKVIDTLGYTIYQHETATVVTTLKKQ
jgi:hypothetical protein